jgi:hypothetical protein
VNSTRGIHSTTVAPTPISSRKLVLPPIEVFSPQGCYSFPVDFIHSVAASAIQIEGAIADKGRTPVHLDVYSQDPTSAPDYIANENYYLYRQDTEHIAAMGVRYYRFSIP